MKEKPTEPRKLTERQGNILTWVIAYMRDNGFPPTIREVGDAMEIKSTNGVFDHFNALSRKGYISRDAFAARSIKILLNPDGTAHQSAGDKLAAINGKLKLVKKECAKSLKSGHPVAVMINEIE